MPELRARALRLLARRDYSRAELKQRLAPHAESEEQLDRLLAALIDERLLCDQRFATQRVAARAARLGDRALRHELERLGVDAETAGAALSESGDETVRCRAVWQRKFRTAPESPEERARQIRFLQSRGFSAETIRRVLRGDED